MTPPKTKFKRKIDMSSTPVLLNADEIAARRIALEDAEVNLGKNGNWLCHYCSKRYTSETVFMKHFCEPKRRASELMSPLGQAAFGYYVSWMSMRKFGKPSAAAFLESKFYRSFINFAEMIINANIGKPEKYMELMIDGQLPPALWCNNNAYAAYLKYTDKTENPLQSVADTINYLFDIVEKENVSNISNIAAHLGTQRIINYVRQKRISPWVIFTSSAFKTFLQGMDSEEKKVFKDVICADYWVNKIKQNPETLREIKEIVEEIGL